MVYPPPPIGEQWFLATYAKSLYAKAPLADAFWAKALWAEVLANAPWAESQYVWNRGSTKLYTVKALQ